MVLLERKRLTSGTTWHAAGLITQARPTYGTREIVRRSLRVFQSLQEETGFATGFERTGTLHLADGAERLEELLRQASAARANGITAELISAEQAAELFPRCTPGISPGRCTTRTTGGATPPTPPWPWPRAPASTACGSSRTPR